MSQYHFTKKDFDIFTRTGLQNRMEGIKSEIQPKLESLGTYFSSFLHDHTGNSYYPHVAKHLRRTVNPPDDTWVAFSENKRGYKMLPHFQIGLFKDFAFVLYGVIYESEHKNTIADQWLNHMDVFRTLPQDFVMTKDHMKPQYTKLDDLSDEDIKEAILRLKQVKKSDLLFGKIYAVDHPALKSDEKFLQEIEETFEKLLKLT